MRPHARPPSRGADEGWAVLCTLISGFALFGGIGWLLDHWWDTRLMTPLGLVIGMALGIYAVVAQFGKPKAAEQVRTSVPDADAAAALRAARAVNRARAFAARAHSPSDGPPPASTRRETECL